MFKALFQKSIPWILLGLVAFAWSQSCNVARKYKNQSDTFEKTINNLNQKIKYSEVRMNDSILLYQAEVEILEFSLGNLKSKYEDLLKKSKIKPKDVRSVTEVESVIHSVDTVIAETDTFGGLKARLLDDFADISVSVLADRNTIIDYSVRDSLTIISTQKKHSWLFGLIKWSEPKGIRVINHNPKATVTHLNTIEVFEK